MFILSFETSMYDLGEPIIVFTSYCLNVWVIRFDMCDKAGFWYTKLSEEYISMEAFVNNRKLQKLVIGDNYFFP